MMESQVAPPSDEDALSYQMINILAASPRMGTMGATHLVKQMS